MTVKALQRIEAERSLRGDTEVRTGTDGMLKIERARLAKSPGQAKGLGHGPCPWRMAVALGQIVLDVASDVNAKRGGA